MQNVATIGLDLAKQVFQVHGADAEGNTLFNRKLKRAEVKTFLQKLPPCIVAMEACGSANYWAREIGSFGHEIRVLPAQLVKPFVPRGKTDANDAAAICEAARSKNIRSVPVKSTAQQAAAIVLRTRSLFVRQKTKAINALRGHLAEYGLVAEVGAFNVGRLIAAMHNQPETSIPALARFAINEICDEIDRLNERIQRIDGEIAAQAKQDEDVRRLMTIPGVGILTASTIKNYVSDPGGFKSARHFAAWLGLTPKVNSSGGKSRQGSISKMGNPELRSLLFVCATAVIRHGRRTGRMETWLRKLLDRRPYKVAAVALANKIARIVWALLNEGSVYRSPNLRNSAISDT